MQVNVNAGFMLTQTLLPLLDQAPSASIVFTSSGVGKPVARTGELRRIEVCNGRLDASTRR